MKPKIKQKWIAALESDEYKQTKRYLKTEEGFCCLGVLTDLYLQEIGDIWTPEVLDENVFYTYDECGYQLPNDVVEWAGLVHDDPTVEINGITTQLSSLNDDGVDFKEISKLINSSMTQELYPHLFI